jgi:hypothetical protein
MIENIKTIEIPNTPLHLLHITDVKREDNKLTVAYNGYGGMHWVVIDNIPLDDEEKLLEAAYKIQKEIKEKYE